MKIVVLDSIVINNEQKERLESIGELEIFGALPRDDEEIIKRGKDADIIILGWTKITKEILSRLPNLKMISLWATGYDYVDIEEAKKRGIIVTNVPGYAKNAVAELAVSLMLAVSRKIPGADIDVRKSGEYNWDRFKGRELTEKILGIIGLGAIGFKVAQIAKGFDMKVIAYDPFPKEVLAKEYGIEYVDFKRIFTESDITTIHMPLLPATENIISHREISLMKNSSIFINTARAKLVDQDALYEALASRSIYGAGLDDIDLTSESGSKILDLDNVVLTPHMGFYTEEAITAKTDICIDNVMNYVNLQPTNIVNI